MGVEETTQTIQQLEENLSKSVSTLEKIELMNALAWKLRIRNPERAHSICEEVLQLSRSTDGSGQEYVQGIASSLVVLSFLDGEAGNLDTALSRSLEALSYIKDQSDSEILVGAWYTLGWAYYYMGDYPASLEFGLKSLEGARKNGLTEWEMWCLDLVASTYQDPTQALRMYQEAYDTFDKMDSIEGQSRILNNWAYTLFETKEYIPALKLAQKSLQLAKDGGLKGDEINVNATVAEILAAMGEYEQAQSKLHRATSLFDEYGRDISSVYILTDLGQVYLQQNELERAEQHKAIKSLKELLSHADKALYTAKRAGRGQIYLYSE